MILLLALLAALASPEDDLALASQKSADDATRMAAFDRLVDLGNTNLTAVLKTEANVDADARERWVAIRVLGKVGGPQARDALLLRLEDDMPAMRVAAANALGDLGDRTATVPLIKHLDDPAMLVRGAAADALGTLADPSAVPALGRALDDKSGWLRGTSLWVRKHYVEALGRIGDKSALPTLLGALDDPDASVADAAVQAMEGVSGMSFAEGRTASEEREAWRRWAAAQIKGR